MLRRAAFTCLTLAPSWEPWTIFGFMIVGFLPAKSLRCMQEMPTRLDSLSTGLSKNRRFKPYLRWKPAQILLSFEPIYHQSGEKLLRVKLLWVKTLIKILSPEYRHGLMPIKLKHKMVHPLQNGRIIRAGRARIGVSPMLKEAQGYFPSH